jgi:hypothetical protein
MNLYIWDSLFYLLFSAEGIRNTPSVLAFVWQEHITLFQQQIQPP